MSGVKSEISQVRNFALHQPESTPTLRLLYTRDEHGSGLDRTGSGLKPILAGSGLDRTAICLKIGGSGLDRIEKMYFFARIAPEMNVIILNVSKILVVIRYYRFAKWQYYFTINGKNSAENILPFELYPPLPTHVPLRSSTNVNIAEWLVSMPVVRVFVGSALTISFGFA